jgi:uncharacterized protein YdaU (DUF1376 family)
MLWVKLDVNFADHPKIIDLSDAGFRALVTSMLYAQQHLTDGHVSTAAVKRFGLSNWRKVANELTDAGLWHPVDNGWEIHDYLEHQKSKAEVEAMTEARKRAGSKGGKARAQAKSQANAKQVLEQNRSPLPADHRSQITEGFSCSTVDLDKGSASGGPSGANGAVDNWSDPAAIL